MTTTLLLIVFILLALVVGWHFLFILFGGVVAITATVWMFIVGSVVAFCIAILLLFIFTGTGILVLGVLALAWSVLAIVLFPILFPILLPLFIIFLVISYFRRRQNQDKPKINKL